MNPVTLDRAAQWRFAWRMFFVGAAFLLASLLSPLALSERVYGLMAHDIPAETWAMGFMSASMLVLYGLHINGRWFFSPMIRALGYLLLLMLFGVVAVSAVTAIEGVHLTIFAVIYFYPVILRFLLIAVADMRARLERG